jgi:FtsP/CotA-like multicopper oxidase with cupredoxin domain
MCRHPSAKEDPVRRLLVCLVAAALLLLPGACSSTTASGPVTIAVTIAGGKVTPSAATYEVAKGSTVTITVTSDAADTIHVHGYEIEKDVVAGTPLTISFIADQTGSFEVETHVTEVTIATLNVR